MNPVLIWTIAVAGGAAPHDSSLALNDIADTVRANQARLERLLVDVYMTTTVDGHSQIDRHVDAFAPHRCFVDFMHLTGPRDPPWQDNARFQLWLTDEDGSCFHPFKRELLTHVPDRTKAYWRSPYAQAIGWHPEAKFFCSPGGTPFYLEDLFDPEHRGRLQREESIESIESVDCVKITTLDGNDQLWLAPQYGFALVKRVRTEGGNKQIVHCRDFRKASEVVWLPWAVDSSMFTCGEGGERLRRQFRLDVTRLDVNAHVPDALFEFSAPPGTLTIEREECIKFTPGGEDLLDLWTAVCARAFPFESAIAGRRWHSLAWSVAAIVAGAISLVVVVAYGGSNRVCSEMSQQSGHLRRYEQE